MCAVYRRRPASGPPSITTATATSIETKACSITQRATACPYNNRDWNLEIFPAAKMEMELMTLLLKSIDDRRRQKDFIEHQLTSQRSNPNNPYPYCNTDDGRPFTRIYEPMDPFSHMPAVIEKSFFKALTLFLRFFLIKRYLGLNAVKANPTFWNTEKNSLQPQLQGWKGISWCEIARGLDDPSKQTYKWFEKACKKNQRTQLPEDQDPWLFGPRGQIQFHVILLVMRHYTDLSRSLDLDLRDQFINLGHWEALGLTLTTDRAWTQQLFFDSRTKTLISLASEIELQISKVQAIYFEWFCKLGSECQYCAGEIEKSRDVNAHGEWYDWFSDFRLCARPRWQTSVRGVVLLPYTRAYFKKNYPTALRLVARRIHYGAFVRNGQDQVNREAMFAFAETMPTKPWTEMKRDLPEWKGLQSVPVGGINVENDAGIVYPSLLGRCDDISYDGQDLDEIDETPLEDWESNGGLPVGCVFTPFEYYVRHGGKEKSLFSSTEAFLTWQGHLLDAEYPNLGKVCQDQEGNFIYTEFLDGEKEETEPVQRAPATASATVTQAA